MSKTEPLDKEEVYRRLPSLNLIEDETIRHTTAQLSAQAPEYFWNVPASVSSYHHPICREERGLWVHTLMVSTAVERLADSYEARFDVDVDHARSAAILHDQRKNGAPEAPSTSSVSDHDLQMAQVIRESGLPETVADAVAAHMGPWYDGPDPESPLDELVHNADMLASTEDATLAVPGPVPGEIQEYELTSAEL